MRIIKNSNRIDPKVSLILVDWSVRESFHLLHYLSKQNVDRNLFEVIIIEYYSRVSGAISVFEDQVDSWFLLDMPAGCYYHKHVMYNLGIVAAKGDICVFCDSDAMVRSGFIESIIIEFERHSNIVLHFDQFRNFRKDLYPFCYPDFSVVTGKGCINNVLGKPLGMMDNGDTIHSRNYGACMCARREDLIAIGGADEHVDYLGHICGPYEMTFRLVNFGHLEIWHQTEFLYHTWHPGQAGEDNYLGPHDGRHMSTTALDALITSRIIPLQENESIKNFRLATKLKQGTDTFLISQENLILWRKQNIRKDMKWAIGKSSRKIWYGFVIDQTSNGFVAYPRFLECPDFSRFEDQLKIYASTEAELHQRLDGKMLFRFRFVFLVVTFLTYVSTAFWFILLYVQRRWQRFTQKFHARCA